MKPVLYLFSRDLRLEDNSGLSAAAASGAPVIPCVCFNPDDWGPFSASFITQCLEELDHQITLQGGSLVILAGDIVPAIEKLLQSTEFSDLFLEHDCTPARQELVRRVSSVCPVHAIEGRTLVSPSELLKQDGSPYQVFTPFLKKVLTLDIDPPAGQTGVRWYWGNTGMPANKAPKGFGETTVPGGRSSGIKALKNLENLHEYPGTRDIPSCETSRLSPHLAFGTISPREAFMAAASLFGMNSVFAGELVWREFWYYIAHHFPHVFSGCFIRRYDRLTWSDDRKAFNTWCEGRTGFPIVDAGMRELNTTGFMHNRVRMITASFLVKDLHINWKWGENYFADKLIDYDPCVNNGNWQWSASTGCDPQPFFRVFNPWTQQQKFDPKCTYIHRWVRELTGIDPYAVHKHETSNIPGYPKPMADHKTERLIALDVYRSVPR